MKLVVCGPPHSGKSVFLSGLCKNLPRKDRYLFRACPDGEGTWTYKGNGSKKYRRKGEFSDENVDWYCQSLKGDELARITLVDIGGIPSSENARILTEGNVDYGIILAGELDAVPEWKNFLQRCEVEVLTVIHSDYNGEMDDIDSSPMSVHYLERGEDVSSRPVIRKVASMILDLVDVKNKEVKMFSSNILQISGLAEKLGKKKEDLELSSGKVIQTIIWKGGDLPKIAKILHNKSAELPDHVKINGAAPSWLVAALTHECHPNSVSLNSPDGYIPVGCRKPSGDGKGVEFEVTNGPDDWTVVTFKLNPDKPLDSEALDDIAPPELGMGAKVIISGRGPNWLTASLAMAYHGTAKAVACFQPGTGSTVSWTHSATVELGEVIEGNV